jgi:mono/diheme cytochrome c family protein
MSGFGNKGLRTLGTAALVAGAVACQPLPPAGQTAADPQPGLALAQAGCSGCHALDQRSVSPNPNAPPFAAIVNQQGLTRNTLAAWLRNAHNYPDEMKFSLDGHKVDDLVAYMLTLRDRNYRPPI